ncbi:conserved hypothetical protein [uncultured Paludibacter sp.]|uniref:Tetratricopeptide repeat protein n=1 Tax=uncultured Paludibacter sp. TaxID=497635 RepID=A0A653A5L5_9BACT|nr:conserved hypothetical protein [uncultured Paludibacter sp.]
MKPKNISPLFFIISILLLNSCTSKMYFTTLDVLKPAEVTFPLDINNVVIVNNSVPQPSNTGHLTTTLYGNKTNETLQFDSAAIFITAGLRDALNTKSFFNGVELSLSNQNTTNNYNYINKLSMERVKTLCKMYNVDAVVSLNKVQLTDNISEFYTEEGSFYNELDVKVKTDWTMYYPDKKNTNIQFVDSFLWTSDNYDRMKARDELPKRYNALVDATILTGSNIADRMIPRWEKEDRYFFCPKDKLMLQAMDSVPLRKWDKAIELWKTAAETSTKNKIKYQAYNNIAIANEIIGNMDEAVNYAKKALDTYSMIPYSSDKDGYQLITYYQNIVNRREEMKLLKKQLGN